MLRAAGLRDEVDLYIVPVMAVRRKLARLDSEKLLEILERVKGIEPSYSAWKAAALPLSYTRVRPMNYHAKDVASTAMRRPGASNRKFAPPCPAKRPLFPQASFAPARPLTGADSLPILRFPSTTKGGDPVSYTKRCHLAGIAR